jgi:hypothetical protein
MLNFEVCVKAVVSLQQESGNKRVPVNQPNSHCFTEVRINS